MMPAAEGMSKVIPCHVLRVGQTTCLDSSQGNVPQPPGVSKPEFHLVDHDLDMTLESLNQLILDMDPTFEPIRSPTCTSPPAVSRSSDDSDGASHCVLIPRGCPPHSSPAVALPVVSPSVPIPTPGSLRSSPNGALVFSGSPTSSLPPLPFGSAPRRNPSPKNDLAFSPGSMCLSGSNRNSATSLLSMSACSDTSYILGSNLSLTEDPDSPESIPTCALSPFNDGSKCPPFDSRASLSKHGHLLELHSRGANSSPASLAGSQTDIPLLLINGAPESDLRPSGSEADLVQKVPASPSKRRCFQASFSGSQPSMKFVMNTSKFWFRPHISRAEAEGLLKDKEAGTFVVRDSTSYRGSFGLAMKVDQSPTTLTAAACPGESGSDHIRHFLIESSAKGVRIRGSSQEPYFGSLSALVYQHTISPFALPCRLLLNYQDMSTTGEKVNEKASTENKRTASNFIYLNAVPTEMLTGPCAVQKAVSLTLEKTPGSFSPTIVNMKVSLKGVTLTDINRKLFFRRHYPAYLLSYGGEDPDNRLWLRGTSFGARMFGFVAKGVEAGMENVCHIFAECDPLQPCSKAIEYIQASITKQ
ncbi:PREDICTED: tensin-4 [Poecilia mexicana]|uniref:tensin-4 n=1 Tax=Poecilia formosa TaxID=48698 RepID=UPI0004438938|nr:PREDICTED: tensin-4 [Poecilia formosa]XP_014843647.1 PREDICTED: tensin-4 [Poecilia mexicana]